ncbi:MAG: OmpA family protein [Deltaproteobacteria bacterium]|nr:OmpA family protein [Deltaproteobacteria bacterium]
MTELSFERGADTLPIGVERVVGALAAWAKQNPEGFVVVEGHTDRYGDAKRNLALSVRRADSVVKQLLALGIARDQIVIGGFGMSPKGRRVVVWTSRSDVQTIEAQLRARGAKTVQTSVLVASL